MTDFTPTVQLPSLVTQMVTALARKALTVAATALIGWGVLPEGQSDGFVSVGLGLALGAASVAWTWWEKRRVRAVLAAAVVAPAGVPVDSAGKVVAPHG